MLPFIYSLLAGFIIQPLHCQYKSNDCLSIHCLQDLIQDPWGCDHGQGDAVILIWFKGVDRRWAD
jgi:hypothetical protein